MHYYNFKNIWLLSSPGKHWAWWTCGAKRRSGNITVYTMCDYKWVIGSHENVGHFRRKYNFHLYSLRIGYVSSHTIINAWVYVNDHCHSRDLKVKKDLLGPMVFLWVSVSSPSTLLLKMTFLFIQTCTIVPQGLPGVQGPPGPPGFPGCNGTKVSICITDNK